MKNHRNGNNVTPKPLLSPLRSPFPNRPKKKETSHVRRRPRPHTTKFHLFHNLFTPTAYPILNSHSHKTPSHSSSPATAHPPSSPTTQTDGISSHACLRRGFVGLRGRYLGRYYGEGREVIMEYGSGRHMGGTYKSAVGVDAYR
jgi:hypothetical protein